jgi:hypothetical protein
MGKNRKDLIKAIHYIILLLSSEDKNATWVFKIYLTISFN